MNTKKRTRAADKLRPIVGRDLLEGFRPFPKMPEHIEALYGAANEYATIEGARVQAICGIQTIEPAPGGKGEWAICINMNGQPPLFHRKPNNGVRGGVTASGTPYPGQPGLQEDRT